MILEPELHLLDQATALEEFAMRRKGVFLVFSYPKCRVEQATENPTCL